MFERKPKHKALRHVARVGAAIICGLVAFQLGGCVLERLNTEAKKRVNTKVDQFIAGDELTTDQYLVARAIAPMNGGAYYEAEALLDSTLQINLSNQVALLNLGAVYEATGRLEKATQVYAQLSDPAARPVTGEGLGNNDVARLAASRLAVLRAGVATANLRQAIWNKAQAAAPRPTQAMVRSDIKSATPPTKTAKNTAQNTAKKTAATDAKKSGEAKRALVTLSTHASEAEAKGGWDTLVKDHGAILGKLTPTIKPIKQDGGKPNVFRLTTGPFGSAREAATFCDQLLARRIYCVISG